MENSIGTKVSIGVSNYIKNFERLLKSVDEAKYALECRIFVGSDKIIYYETINQTSNKAHIDLLNQKIENIKRAFENKEYEIVLRELKSIYFKDIINGFMQYNYLKHVNTLLLGFLLGFLTTKCINRNIKFSEVFGEETAYLEEINNLETVSDIYKWMHNKFMLLINLVKEQDKPSYSNRVQKIITYINNNYMKGITIDDIANEFALNKIYLGQIFKKETGISLNRFINQVRIAKAKELLKQTDLQINEIVYLCGFNNPQNFYYTFNKYVGKNPSDYRND